MNCSTWLWIELIGFDNERADFGVPELLDRAGFVPDAVALLLSNPAFVHDHDGMSEDRTLAPDICCYGGYAASEERERQAWTQHQVRGLVRELHATGTKVYPSVFDMYRTASPWLAEHQEVLYVSRTRGRIESVCPWKRLADGTLYEDFFIARLAEVIGDYGFDGFFGADGYNPPRLPIYDGDFSDDMVEQFCRATGGVLPDHLAGSCDSDRERMAARGEWIWRNRRRDWIDFYATRTAAFWHKLVAAVHALGKQVHVNTTWTKGPFESLYRYGVDYRRLAAAGIDGFVVEAAAAALETLVEPEPRARVLCSFAAAILLNKAYVPGTPMLWLHGVKDTNENWHALRQTPMALESEILTFANLFRCTAEGALERCVDGPVVCLADGIRRHEWEWLRRRWELGFAFAPASVLGATVLWSDRAFEREVDDYIATQRWTVHRLLHHLLARGAAIHAAAGIADLDRVRGAVVVLNAHLWPADELQRALAYGHGPVGLITADAMDTPTPSARFPDPDGSGYLACALYGCAGPLGCGPDLAASPEPVVEAAHTDDLDRLPALFYDPLPFRRVSDAFISLCATAINRCAHPGIRLMPEEAPLSACVLRGQGGELRLLIRNDGHTSVAAEVDIGDPIAEVQFPNATTGMTISPHGSRFCVRVPPRGTALCDVSLARPTR